MAAIDIDGTGARAAVLLFKKADRDTAKRIRAAQRPIIEDMRAAVKSRGRSGPDREVARTARLLGGNSNPTLVMGRATRPSPVDLPRQYEFGSPTRRRSKTYRVNPPGAGFVKTGRSYTVTRRTRAHLPPPYRRGRMFYPALAQHGRPLVAAWARAVVGAWREPI
jgi:hypothetical protein